MIRFRRMTLENPGAPGRAERLLATVALCALVVALIVTCVGVAAARMEVAVPGKDNPGGNPPDRAQSYYGWYHNVGQLLLHVSNLGFFGDWPSAPWDDIEAPSAEWPAGSAHNYLYAAGLWVGGEVLDSETGEVDTLVTAGVYQREYRPDPDPLKVMYNTWEGAALSGRYFDDDGDCRPDLDEGFEHYDEDLLDGIDNDGDGLIDEDFAAISQQMFRCEYEDTNEEDVNEGQSVDLHRSMGLRVIQESYQWTSEQTDDFVGIDFTVVNIGEDTIRMAYVGFMVDADAGPEDIDGYYTDDRGGFIDTMIVNANPNNPTELDTLSIALAYMYDDPYGVDGNVAQGYFGCMFLGHPTIDPDSVVVGEFPPVPTQVRLHAFEIWSSSGEDPRNDEERYEFLMGDAHYPMLDGRDNDNDGEIDEEDEWRVNIDRNADAPLDWRFMLSAGPFARIVPGDSLSFQYAFVMGQGLDGLLENAATAQQIYNGSTQDIPNCAGDEFIDVEVNWVADTPPPPPNQEITAGDHFVRVEWDDFPEDVEDPLTRVKDFYGYQVWKAVGWTRESSEPRDQDWQLILDADRGHGGQELEELDTGLEGIGKYSFVDENVKNGFSYWYSVTAYDSTGGGEDPVVYHYGKYTQNKTLVVPQSSVQDNLDEIWVVPNPYVNHEYMARWNLEPSEEDPTGEKVCFQNLPRDAVVRIYSLGGELVQTLYPDADETGGDACWNMISRNNQIIVSGVYLYHVDSPVGEQVGKFVIIK